MHDIINGMSTWSILKWVVIVLVAGFIGQFGKSMAQAIMAKIRLARANKQEAKNTGSPRTILPETEAPDPVKNIFHEAPTANAETPDKKTLKNLTKQEKKAAKLVKKGI
ncbi:MAG: hypothetical protein NT178_08765 [Proteobacteria bacterium]|nr:hypothetical protein [Pseudomonadota bacterium]